MTKNKFFRAAALIIAVSLFAALPAGCSQNEMSLLGALMNTTPVYSYESTGNVSISLDIVPADMDTYDGGDYVNAACRVLKAYLDGASLATSIRVNSDKDYKNIKEEIIITPTMFGGQMKDLSLGMWMDLNSLDADHSDVYVKMPAILAALSKDTAGKDYLTMNLGKIIDIFDVFGESSGINLGEMLDYAYFANSAEDFMKPISKAVLKAASKMKPDEIYVSGVRPVTGEDDKQARVYTLTISDKGLKKLLRSVVNDVDKETAKETAMAVLDVSINYLSYFDSTYEDTLEELEYVKQELDEGFDFVYDYALENFNLLLDAVDNIRILGKQGVTFDIEVNSDGFVTAYDGVMDFSVDIAAIAKYSDSYSIWKYIKRMDFTIKMNQRMTRINKIVKIEMPETNAKNSVSLESIIAAQWEPYSGYDDYYGYDEYDYDVYDYDDYDYDGDYIAESSVAFE